MARIRCVVSFVTAKESYEEGEVLDLPLRSVQKYIDAGFFVVLPETATKESRKRAVKPKAEKR